MPVVRLSTLWYIDKSKYTEGTEQNFIGEWKYQVGAKSNSSSDRTPLNKHHWEHPCHFKT